MSEWIHEGLPYYCEESEVWLDDGSVRRVRRDVGCGIRFIDCTHPLQNVVCEEDRIKAWRPKRLLTDAEIAAQVQAIMNTPMSSGAYLANSLSSHNKPQLAQA